MRFIIFFVLSVFFLAELIYHSSNEIKYVSVASWNLENLFDTEDDPLTEDEEFTPDGSKNWTEDKLESKLNNLHKVIKFINNGNGPDVIAVQEVENLNVLQFLIKKCRYFRKYEAVHFESPDKRGIDVALLYDKNIFKPVKKFAHRVDLEFETRPVLEAVLKHTSGDTISFFVNHWPSRKGGKDLSEKYRMEASETLKSAIEQNFNNYQSGNIIILGDFNDEPGDKSISNLIENNSFNLLNLAENISLSDSGSYLYKGNWDMLDQIIISEKMTRCRIKYSDNSFKIVKPEFLITKNGKYKGSAIPTFGGKDYHGGYSDHFPVTANFLICN
ncbi:MAG: hypothetical protein GXX85_13595 [Ignavibacteria bacterium]|nr:hypothetical protein [Ignavibacteria bacterium]